MYKDKFYSFDNAKSASEVGKFFHLEDGYELVNISDANYQAKFCQGYLFNYTTLNKVLNEKYKNYFDYFSIGFDDIERNADNLESTIEIRYNIPINEIAGLSVYFRHNPIKFIMLNEAFDSSFDSLHEKIKTKIFPGDNKNINNLFDKLLKEIYGIKGFNAISKINEKFINLIYDTSEYTSLLNSEKCKIENKIENKIKNKIKNVLFPFKCENLKYQKLKEYPSCNYKKYLEKIKDFEERLNKIYHTPLNKNANINIWQYFYFNLFKKTKSGNIYFYKLSKGEQQQYITILNLYYKSVRANSLAQTLIFEDDIDANLHPEWSRMFIYTYIKALKSFSKNKNKTRNIILSKYEFCIKVTTNNKNLQKKTQKTIQIFNLKNRYNSEDTKSDMRPFINTLVNTTTFKFNDYPKLSGYDKNLICNLFEVPYKNINKKRYGKLKNDLAKKYLGIN